MADNINTLILRVLNEGEHYGLDIIKRISEISQDSEIKQPSLYSALRRLEEKGFVESYWEDGVEGGRRHFYKISPMGEDELKLESNMEEFQKSKQNDDSSIPNDEISPIENDDTPPFDIEEPIIDSASQVEEEPSIFSNILSKDDSISDFDQGSSAEITNFNPYEDENNEEIVSETPEFEATEDEHSFDFDEDKPESIDTSEEEPEDDEIIPLATHNEPVYANFSQNDNVVASENTFKETTNERKFDDIDYKDILGDLEADNTFDDFEENRTKIVEASISSMPTVNNSPITSPPVEQPKSRHTKYTQQVAEIFSKKRTKTTSQVPASPIFGVKNKEIESKLVSKEKNALEELALKYNAEGKLPNKKTINPLEKLVSKDVGYSHIKQEDVCIRTYNKKSFAKINTKKFVLYNQFNLFKAFLISILLCAELIICYQTCQSQNLYGPIHDYFYIIFGSFGLVYLLLNCVLSAKDINKKVSIDSLRPWQNLGIRTAFAILIVAFSIGMSFCCGMTDFFEINFLLCWLLPTIVAADLIIAWLLTIIMHLIRLFRA